MTLFTLILCSLLEFVLPSSFEASWTQVRHSPILTENLVSSGTVIIREPSYLRWEVIEPVQSVTEYGADSSRGRFKMPSQKDFMATQEGEAMILEPLRKDLKQMFRRITVTFDKSSGKPQSVFLEGTDEGWIRIEFKDIK